MIELFVTAAIAVAVLVAVGALAVFVLALELIGWLFLWPGRLVLFFLFLPVLLLKWALGFMLSLLAGVVLLPIVAVGLVLGLFAAVAASLLPVLPLLLIALLVWVAVAALSRPLRVA